jgi:hypothetical protein
VIKKDGTFFAKPHTGDGDQGTFTLTDAGLNLIVSGSNDKWTVAKNDDNSEGRAVFVCRPGGADCFHLYWQAAHMCAHDIDCKQQCISGPEPTDAHQCESCDVSRGVCRFASDDGTSSTAGASQPAHMTYYGNWPGSTAGAVNYDLRFALKADGTFFAQTRTRGGHYDDPWDGAWQSGTYRVSKDNWVFTLTAPKQTWSFEWQDGALIEPDGTAFDSKDGMEEGLIATEVPTGENDVCFNQADCDNQRGETCTGNTCLR